LSSTQPSSLLQAPCWPYFKIFNCGHSGHVRQWTSLTFICGAVTSVQRSS
jgi:hypothetical protein